MIEFLKTLDILVWGLMNGFNEWGTRSPSPSRSPFTSISPKYGCMLESLKNQEADRASIAISDIMSGFNRTHPEAFELWREFNYKHPSIAPSWLPKMRSHGRIALVENSEGERLELLESLVPPACHSCSHYHGKVYEGVRLICGFHPYGFIGECPDREDQTAL